VNSSSADEAARSAAACGTTARARCHPMQPPVRP
jgi:hypothetical protein